MASRTTGLLEATLKCQGRVVDHKKELTGIVLSTGDAATKLARLRNAILHYHAELGDDGQGSEARVAFSKLDNLDTHGLRFVTSTMERVTRPWAEHNNLIGRVSDIIRAPGKNAEEKVDDIANLLM